MATVDSIAGLGIGDRIAASLEVRRYRARLRQFLLKMFGLVVLAAALAYGFYEWEALPSVVSTDDAYVQAVFAQVTPQIDGTISSIRVHDTQGVHRGDILITLDQKDAQLDYQGAQAAYDEARRKVQQELANENAAQANVQAKQSLLIQAEQQLRRRANIKQPGIVAVEEIANYRTALDAAKYALSIAEQQLAAERAIAGDIASNPEILAAKTALDRARLHLDRTVIRAPVDGIVAQSRVQVGARIATGTELMTIVPIHQLFVDANFKESQITHIRLGQSVTLTSDIYGRSRIFHGRVEGMGGGTGAAFAIIPPQNATGNWIKVVQRLPVRIAIDPDELKDNPLRVGISMTADVHLDQYVTPPVQRAPASKAVALRAAASGIY